MGLASRNIRAELLDELPATDARAIRSRGDLRRVNAWMGNARLVARCWETPRSGSRIVEIGAGDGTFLLAVARRWGVPGIEATLVDRCELLSPRTRQAFSALDWKIRIAKADVFEWLQTNPEGAVDVVLANLFLHHFPAEKLACLLTSIAGRTRLMIACEPERSHLALAGVQLLPLIGCNDVTRHDARVSVGAGFAGRELSALWPADKKWKLQEGPGNLFSHLFCARRLS